MVIFVIAYPYSFHNKKRSRRLLLPPLNQLGVHTRQNKLDMCVMHRTAYDQIVYNAF